MLCPSCSQLVDADKARFSVERLFLDDMSRQAAKPIWQVDRGQIEGQIAPRLITAYPAES